MTENLPSPLTPPDCDLRAFKDMPLEAATLRDARIVDVTSGDEFKAAILLWAAAWHQIPAGSLPDDDAQLAKYAGFGRVVREWQKVKTGALYGFVKCDDGRLYHRFLCTKALVAWDSRREHAWRRECDRIRKENKQRADQGESALPLPPSPTKLANAPSDHSNGKEELSAGKSLVSDGKRDDDSGIPAENALKGREGKGNEGSLPLPKGNGQASPALVVVNENPQGEKPQGGSAPDPWAEVYRRGKEILGQSAGGTITLLRHFFDQKPRKVLAKLEDAAEQRQPVPWINAFLWANIRTIAARFACRTNRGAPMKTTSEILGAHGSAFSSPKSGNQKTLCPRCSHTRRNKRDRCLSVLIDESGVQWNCHHCEFTGGEFYDEKPFTPGASRFGKAPHLSRDRVEVWRAFR